MKRILNLLLAGSLALASCSEKKADPVQYASVSVPYTFKAANGTTVYKGQEFDVQSPRNEHITVSLCNLYLSNVELLKSDGSGWKEPNSYHLLAMPLPGTAASRFVLDSVPVGTYTSIRYAFGVDAASNRSLDKKGDLDPANGMAWDWNTGYRFLVLEGKVREAGGVDSGLVWHIGNDANYKVRTITLVKPFSVSGSTTSLDLTVDLNTFFYGQHSVSPFTSHNLMMDTAATRLAAENVVEAFRFNAR